MPDDEDDGQEDIANDDDDDEGELDAVLSFPMLAPGCSLSFVAACDALLASRWQEEEGVRRVTGTPPAPLMMMAIMS